MDWYNEPTIWREEGDTITVRANPQTDFWRKTHDGGIRDNGHFYLQTVTGDFTAQVKVTGQYSDLYDQAGLMIRLDEANWLKCGIEYVESVQQASAVCTRDWSDWSVLPLPNPPYVLFRVVYRNSTAEVYYSLDGTTYTMIRQTYFPQVLGLQVGIMIAAPTGKGFEASFTGFQVDSN